MLLMKLEAKEKFAFLQLAHYLARIDGEFQSDEEKIIEEYCAEMGIDNSVHFLMDKFDLENTLSIFKSPQSKKIVVLELMILVHIDNRFDITEYELVEKLFISFNLSSDELKEYSSWGKAVSALYEQGVKLIKD